MSQAKLFSIFALTGKSVKTNRSTKHVSLVITSTWQTTEEFHDQLYNASRMEKNKIYEE